MDEFYPHDLLTRSRTLYEAIKAWATDQGGVTLIGGWAVYETVDEGQRMQSRDVDLIIHDRDTLMALDQQLPRWDLQWREAGRNRFNDCHFRDDPQKQIVVDVFKDHPFEERVFRGMRARMGVAVKSAAGHGFLPSLEYLVADKLRTIPLRHRDRKSKQAKDLLDLYALVFHNRHGVGPSDLLSFGSRQARAAAAEALAPSRRLRPQNREAFDAIEAWLQDVDAP